MQIKKYPIMMEKATYVDLPTNCKSDFDRQLLLTEGSRFIFRQTFLAPSGRGG